MEETKEIRVLIMVDGMPAGGTERQIVELLKGLKESDTGVRTFLGILQKGGPREEEACRYADEVINIRQSLPYDITLAFSLIGVVKKKRIAIMHTFGSISDLSGVVAAKVTGIKLINGSIRNARRKLTLRDRISLFSMSFADQIVANSHAGLKSYRVDLQKNVQVIYNGVDFSRFETVKPFEYHRSYICMVGNFTPKKDQQSLVNAFFDVAVHFPQHDLILVGRGKNEQECRDLVSTRGLCERVLFVNNCNSPESYIRGSDVCVLLSPDGEGLSNVIIEYYALSKPVIATNLGGNPEIIKNGQTGTLLQSHSQDEVSGAIIDLLQNTEKSKMYGELGRERVFCKYAIERMIDDYSELYRRLVLEK